MIFFFFFVWKTKSGIWILFLEMNNFSLENDTIKGILYNIGIYVYI